MAALRFRLLHQVAISFLAVDGLHTPAFQVVIPAGEHFTGESQFVKKPRHRVGYQFVARTAGVAGQLIQLGLNVRCEMYFRAVAPFTRVTSTRLRRGAALPNNRADLFIIDSARRPSENLLSRVVAASAHR